MLDVSGPLGDIKDLDKKKKNDKNAVKMRDDFQDYSSSNRDLLPWLQICVQHTEHVKEDD